MRHVMDHTVGLNAAVAALAALHRRRATGEGQWVDVAARDVASSLIGEALLLAAAGAQPERTGNDHPRMAPHGVYPAAGDDNWISIAVGDDAGWRALAKVIGQPDLAHDPRFATAPERHARRAELDHIVAAWTAQVAAEDAAARLQAAGVAAHASWTTREIVADPHLRARRAIVDVHEPDGTERAAVGAPMRLSKGAEIGIDRGTPKLGEHEDYVYGELLGMTTAERQALQDEEVIY
jgi:crotonobetainyl-CoA:carnitine CoA-transferase CaiB-like acyl-CoA transferase